MCHLQEVRALSPFEHLRLLFADDKPFCRSLSRIIGFCPRNVSLYREAFMHSSMNGKGSNAADTGGGRRANNERLEYLGDAILGAVSADILYHRYPTRREGFLTTARSRMVQRSTLGRVAHEMGLEAFIHTSSLQQSHNSFIYGNAFEALVGAIYLDRGYHVCYRFIEQRVLGKYIQVDEVATHETNYKSSILEWCQKHGYPITFDLLDETLQPEGPVFHSAVIICGVQAGQGTGYTKKESHQQAAREALSHIRHRHAVYQAIIAAAQAAATSEGEEDGGLENARQQSEKEAESSSSVTP